MAILEDAGNYLKGVLERTNMYYNPEYIQQEQNLQAKSVMQKLADQYANFQAGGQGLPDYQAQDIAQGLAPMTSLMNAAKSGDKSAIKRLAEYNQQIENSRNATAQLAAVSPSQAPALSALASQTNPLIQQIGVQGAVLDQQQERAKIANEMSQARKNQFESLSPSAQNAVSFANPTVQGALLTIQNQQQNQSPVQINGQSGYNDITQPSSISDMVKKQVLAGFRTPEQQMAENEKATTNQKNLIDAQNSNRDILNQVQSNRATLSALRSISPQVPWGNGLGEAGLKAQAAAANFNQTPEGIALAKWNQLQGTQFLNGIRNTMQNGGVGGRMDLPIVQALQENSTIPATYTPAQKEAVINSMQAINNNAAVLSNAKLQSLQSGKVVTPKIYPYEKAEALANKNKQPIPVVLDALSNAGYIVTPSAMSLSKENK